MPRKTPARRLRPRRPLPDPQTAIAKAGGSTEPPRRLTFKDEPAVVTDWHGEQLRHRALKLAVQLHWRPSGDPSGERVIDTAQRFVRYIQGREG